MVALVTKASPAGSVFRNSPTRSRASPGQAGEASPEELDRLALHLPAKLGLVIQHGMGTRAEGPVVQECDGRVQDPLIPDGRPIRAPQCVLFHPVLRIHGRTQYSGAVPRSPGKNEGDDPSRPRASALHVAAGF